MTIMTWDNVNEPNFKRGREAAINVYLHTRGKYDR